MASSSVASSRPFQTLFLGETARVTQMKPLGMPGQTSLLWLQGMHITSMLKHENED